MAILLLPLPSYSSTWRHHCYIINHLCLKLTVWSRTLLLWSSKITPTWFTASPGPLSTNHWVAFHNDWFFYQFYMGGVQDIWPNNMTVGYLRKQKKQKVTFIFSSSYRTLLSSKVGHKVLIPKGPLSPYPDETSSLILREADISRKVLVASWIYHP